MGVAFLSTPASMTGEQYDRLIKQLDASRAGAPSGRRFHACFGPAHHLTVLDVRDSAEEFQALGKTTLVPIPGGDVSILRKTIADLREKAFSLRPVEKFGETIHKAKKKSSEEDKPSGSATK